VVVSIIVLLISMLVPAFGKVKSAAHQVACLSNLQQVSKASVQYVLANQRRFPSKGPSMYSWVGTAGKVYLKTFGADQRAFNPFLAGGPFAADQEVPLAQCPRDTGAEWGNGISSYEAQGASYGSNTHTSIPSLFNGGQAGVSMKRLKSPARMVVMGDNPAFASAWWSTGYWNAAAKVPGFFWHDEAFRWNLSFADGHAGFTEVLSSQIYGDDYTFHRDY